MTNALRSTRILLPVVLVAAAISPVRGQTAPSADEKELAAYRLTMPTLNKVVAAMRTFQQDMLKDPKYQELMKVEERIDKVEARLKAIQAETEAIEAKEQPTKADEEKLAALNAEADKLNEQSAELSEERDKAREAASPDSAMSSNPKTLTEMEQSIARVPQLQRALQREGLTTREYSKFMLAMLQAAMIHGFSQGKVDYAKLPPGVNPDNVKFIETHKAELEAMQKEFAAMNRRN